MISNTRLKKLINSGIKLHDLEEYHSSLVGYTENNDYLMTISKDILSLIVLRKHESKKNMILKIMTEQLPSSITIMNDHSGRKKEEFFLVSIISRLFMIKIKQFNESLDDYNDRSLDFQDIHDRISELITSIYEIDSSSYETTDYYLIDENNRSNKTFTNPNE